MLQGGLPGLPDHRCSAAQVDFDTHLDMAPYMSKRRAGSQMYELFGVLVHAGHSVHSGHYYCYVRAPNGLWHHMDDNQVSQVCPLGDHAQLLSMLTCWLKAHTQKGHDAGQSNHSTTVLIELVAKACRCAPGPLGAYQDRARFLGCKRKRI